MWALVPGGLGGTARTVSVCLSGSGVGRGTHCKIVVMDPDPVEPGRPGSVLGPGPSDRAGSPAPSGRPFSWQPRRKRGDAADKLIQEMALPAAAPDTATCSVAPPHQESCHWAAM